MLGRIQSQLLSVFADVFEHNRIGDAATAVGEAQFEIRIAQGLELFREVGNRLSALWLSFR
jgi:hypothetical protein